MRKIILKIIGNGFLYGVYAFLLCFLMGYFVFPIKTLLSVSIPIAICAIIINGAIYTRFTKPIKILEKINISIDNLENVLLQAPANHFIENDIVSGKLCLTDKRLIFKSHTEQEFEWIKSDLHTMVFYPSFKNKGGEFTVKNKADKRLAFEVDQIKMWKNELKK